MAFTKTPMTAEERKEKRRVAALKDYHDNIDARRAAQNARKRADPEKTKAQRNAYRAADPERYKEYDRKDQMKQRIRHPWRSSFNAARKRARKKGLEFTITHDWARANFTGFCALTGLPFAVREEVGKSGPGPFSPSLDQIEPAKGYTPDNCRYVLFAVNAFKHVLSDAEMRVVAEALLANR
jgi:hypothetical protein